MNAPNTKNTSIHNLTTEIGYFFNVTLKALAEKNTLNIF